MKSIALCSCSSKVPSSGIHIDDPQNRLPPFEEDVVGAQFKLAATIEDAAATIWIDPLELLSHLTTFDRVITFNGEKFDFPLLASAVTRDLDPAIATSQQVIGSNDFFKSYDELHKRSYDLFAIVRDKMGSVVSLANLAESTAKLPRIHSIKTAVKSLSEGDLLGAINFVLEGAMLAYNLHYVATNLRSLSAKGPDDQINVIQL